MKIIMLIVTIFYMSTINTYSSEPAKCENLKKFSIQYTWCKSKTAGKALKNKIKKVKKDKK